MKKAMSVLVILGIVAVLILMWAGGIYNKLVGGEEAVKTAWAQVENVYQRRLDLIPNLVATVKGYAAHEKGTLEAVIEARSKISQVTLGADVVNDPETLNRFQSLQGELSSALSRLMVVVEQYPNLKADQNFLSLQSQLEGTENRIAVERRRYNETAQAYNTMRRTVPNVLVARIMGFEEKAYFQGDANAKTVPVVTFG